MLLVQAIGHIGADAIVQVADGREFVSFRIAHTQRFKNADGQVSEHTQWIDCVMNGRPAVTPYLVKGQQVYVSGAANLRVYDSAKDHCKKAGLQVRCIAVELLGSPRTNDTQKPNETDAAPFWITTRATPI